MVNKISTIKERVVEYVENKGFVKEKFFSEIETTSANFRGNGLKTPLNSTTIVNIITKCPDLNVEWLLTGKGTMLKEDNSSMVVNEPMAHYGKATKEVDKDYVIEVQRDLINRLKAQLEAYESGNKKAV